MRQSFWEKIEEAKTKGISIEQLERIESLEAAIAHHQNQIEEYEREIEQIKGDGRSKSEGVEVVQGSTSLNF